MLPYLVFSLVLIIIQVSHADPKIDPLVQTNVGLIRGVHANDGKYAIFMGIPYAQVDPKNPFGAHIPQPPFDEVFDATREMSMCPQQEEFNNTLTGTLDCLQISIFVPDTASSSNPLPVMVWIHGGGFQYGYGGRIAQGPAFIVKHDVILVTINYRLNAYGFMCLNIPEVPGNQGLRDQEAALNWIKNNINAFGGNENLITIVGESAGAISVDFHLRYRKGNQFNKVIMQSGSASGDWVIKEPDYGSAIKFAEYLGYEPNNTKEALNYLSQANANDVVAAYLKLNIQMWPCIENEFDGHERFITDYAGNIAIPKAKTTPILLGYNNQELLLRYANKTIEYYKNLDDVFFETLALHFNFPNEKITEMEKIVREFYIGDNDVSSKFVTELANFASDLSYMYPVKRSVKEYFINGALDIYQYVFSYNGQRNFVKRRLNALNIEGASHADEIGYLFDVSFFNEQPNERDQLMIDRITTLWTNFAKFSDPTPEVTELIPVRWPPVTSVKSFYLDIGSELVVSTSPMHDRMAFWNLFFMMNDEFRKGFTTC